MDQPMTDEARREVKIRRFSLVVSLALIVACNAVLFAGLRMSGINLDDLVTSPDRFDAKHDVCLRVTWQALPGASEPVRLCSEWLNLSDPSGATHFLKPDTTLKKGPDGQYYVDHAVQADYRLLVLLLFVMVVIMGGVRAKWLLVNRYRLRLESTGGHPLSPTRR